MSRARYQRHVLIITFLCVMALCIVTLVLPHQAHAAVAVVDSGVNANTGRISALTGLIQGLIQRLETKEFRLDPQAKILGTQISMGYVNQQKAYISAGNDGRRFFNVNLEVFNAEITTATAENVIREVEQGGSMCGAFRNQVLTTIRQQFVEQNARTVAQKTTCSIEEVTQNPQAFYNGTEWSTQAFFRATVHDPASADPLSARLRTQALMQEQIDEQLALERAYLDWGQGFLNQYETAQAAGGSVIVCSDPRQRMSTEVNGIRTHECRVATPSSIIKERAANILKIESAIKTDVDEFGEPAAAQLIDSLIIPTMAGGITGRAQSPVPGVTVPNTPPTDPGSTPCIGNANNPFCAFPDVPADPQDPVSQQFLARVADLLNETAASGTIDMRDHLERTMAQLQLHLRTITIIDDLEERNEDARNNAQYSSIGCYTLGFNTSLRNDRTNSIDQAAITFDAIKALTEVFLRYQAADTSGQPTAEAEERYAEIEQSAWIAPDQADLDAVTEDFNNTMELWVGPFLTEHNRQEAACELALNPPDEDEAEQDAVDDAGP